MNIHGAHSYWKQGVYGLELGRSVESVQGRRHIVAASRMQLVLRCVIRCSPALNVMYFMLLWYLRELLRSELTYLLTFLLTIEPVCAESAVKRQSTN